MSDVPEQTDPAPSEPTAPAWMATFGDLMSLLLTFFVLLMSFASMDVRRFAAVVGSMRNAFGVQKLHPGPIESLADSVVHLSETEATPFLRVIDVPTRVPERDQALLDRLQMSLRDHDLERVVQVESTPDGVAVRVPDQMLFGPGSAELRSTAVVFLHEIAQLIRETPGEVSVDGHSDAAPVAAGRYRSNWDLSAARAVSALLHLVEVEGIDPKRLRAAGYGSARPRAGESASSPSNRRVEFVFLRSRDERDGPRESAALSATSQPNTITAAAE